MQHAASIKGKNDVCVMLLQHGADPTLRNTEGKTALDVADPLTRPVLTGTDYKKDELLEAARYCTVLYYTVLYYTVLYW